VTILLRLRHIFSDNSTVMITNVIR